MIQIVKCGTTVSFFFTRLFLFFFYPSTNIHLNWNLPIKYSDACIYFGILVETQEGKRIWHYLQNDAKVPWKKDDWNAYHRTFEITADMLNSRSVTAHIMGPRGGIDIIFDEVEMSNYFKQDSDCNAEMVMNGDLEASFTRLNFTFFYTLFLF